MTDISFPWGNKMWLRLQICCFTDFVAFVLFSRMPLIYNSLVEFYVKFFPGSLLYQDDVCNLDLTSILRKTFFFIFYFSQQIFICISRIWKRQLNFVPPPWTNKDFCELSHSWRCNIFKVPLLCQDLDIHRMSLSQSLICFLRS